MNAKRLHNNITHLGVLSKAKKKQRNALLGAANGDLILCLCECILNILNGGITLKPDELKKLEKHKFTLRQLAAKNVPIKERKGILIQKGGFLPALLMPILGMAGQLLVDKIIKR